MKYLLLFTAISFYFIGSSQSVKDVSIQVQAKVQGNNLINLTWQATSNASNYRVSRRVLGSTDNWVTLKDNIASSTTQYADATGDVGVSYEYFVFKNHANPAMRGYGYAASGMSVPALHKSGDLLLLIDSAVYSNLQSTVEDTLIIDLIGDGWTVETRKIGVGENPVSLKSKIKNWYSSGKVNPHVYLFGHVPVAYSGDFGGGSAVDNPPDAHVPDHNGCWATDAYYSDMNGTWTDLVTNVGSSKPWGKNLPGDGRFDQHRVPDKTAEVAVGRVDLYDLPGISSDQNALLANYIHKAHLWKHGKTIVPKKALIADRLQWFGGEAPGRTGWMNLPGLVGSDNIVENTNYFPHFKEGNTYLFSQVTSSAGYTSISGIGSMTNLKDTVYSVFNTFFGSYFGDWDNRNNFLRAAIASKTHTLTSIWNGRPSWYYQSLGMGNTFGQITKTSISNSGAYFIYNNFLNGVQINLMGDPTLKIHRIQPATNFTGSKSGGDREVSLTWTASTEPNVLGYYVYRSTTNQKNAEYELVNKDLITSTTYTDKQPYYGTSHYMIRPVKLEDRASGTYYNLGQGSFTEVMGVESGNFYTDIKESLEDQCIVYPNPSKGAVFISKSFNGDYDYFVRNAISAILFSGSSNEIIQKLSIENPGIYFIKIMDRNGRSTVKKVLVE